MLELDCDGILGGGVTVVDIEREGLPVYLGTLERFVEPFGKFTDKLFRPSRLSIGFGEYGYDRLALLGPGLFAIDFGLRGFRIDFHDDIPLCVAKEKVFGRIWRFHAFGGFPGKTVTVHEPFGEAQLIGDLALLHRVANVFER